MTAKSVLIVEDEKVLQDVYKLVLSAQGYRIYTANNGAEGLNQLKKNRPSLVLLDVFMPVMDGREFLRNISSSDFPDTKIIVYSNLSDNKTETEMLSLGAEKFVLKSSMTPDDLVELVNAVFLN